MLGDRSCQCERVWERTGETACKGEEKSQLSAISPVPFAAINNANRVDGFLPAW